MSAFQHVSVSAFAAVISAFCFPNFSFSESCFPNFSFEQSKAA